VLRRLRQKSRALPSVVALTIIAGAAVILLVGTKLVSGGSDPSPSKLADAKLAPSPWSGDHTSRPGATQVSAAPQQKAVPAAKPAPIDPATGMPAASAGSNGSYDPPSAAERKRISARIHPAGGAGSSDRTALLINGIALAPPQAPDPIRGAISAANLIVGQPYRLGGGHGSWRSRGYDCSGAVSYALAGGGMLNAPLTSGQFMSWGAPGQGRWLTIYANPGHVYAVIGGLRWDTVGDANGSGPRWHPYDAYPSGFVARHIPGL
jgi:cell wall-associated NlpC family hydrolase